MRERTDLWGCPVTTEDASAVDGLNATLMAYMGMRVDIGDHLKSVFAADPDMPMALIVKGAFLKMFATAAMDEGARRTLAAARDAVTRRPVSTREEGHLSALTDWVAGDMESACRSWEAILVDHPRDVLALKLSQLNRFYLGVGKDMRNAVGRAWYAWDESVPGYGFIAGSYAFALEESGDYARAEPMGRRAIEMEPADIWAAHAVAHVMEMTGRSDEGLAWLNGLKDHWGSIHNFVHHAHWHRALFALDLGDVQQALAIFDNDVWTDKVEDYLDLSNGASLLWRLEERGADIGHRPDAVAELALKKARDHGLVFADCHVALALAMAGRGEALSDFLDDLTRFATRSGTQAQVAADVGRTLCMAAVADAAGDAGQAVELLLSVRPHLHRIGGSHAQRDLFERMLIVNAIRSERIALSRALLSERRENRPEDDWARALGDHLAFAKTA
ncbi:MAG: tetratricopeptide repeat protein [Alphaproteobacteria bacterium]|nr:tetratricopeptide repeat protein [Alphaproteobacteria bacterium]